MKTKPKNTKKKNVPARMVPEKASDILVNQAMLYSVRDELKADIRCLDHKFDGLQNEFLGLCGQFQRLENKFKSLENRFEGLEARFESLEARFESLESRFDALETKFEVFTSKFEASSEKMMSEIYRMRCLAEEQNNKNNAVIDALTGLFHRQDRVGTKVQQLENTLTDFKKISL